MQTECNVATYKKVLCIISIAVACYFEFKLNGLTLTNATVGV